MALDRYSKIDQIVKAILNNIAHDPGIDVLIAMDNNDAKTCHFAHGVGEVEGQPVVALS